MQLILIAAGAIGLVVGSLAAAALLCWILWSGFRVMLHPEWAAAAILMLLVLALMGQLPQSQFLGMTMTFAVIAAIPLWIAGRAWRKERWQVLINPRLQSVEPQPSGAVLPEQSGSSPRLYPAITACIGQERNPTRDEIHLVASRLWREGLALRFGPESKPASFAARRVLLRAAIIALSGRNDEISSKASRVPTVTLLQARKRDGDRPKYNSIT